MNDVPTPQKISVEQVIKNALFYWQSTLFFQLIMSVLYLGILFVGSLNLAQYYLGDQLSMLSSELAKSPTEHSEKIAEISNTENGSLFTMMLFILKASLFPLNIGLFRIYSKIDAKEKVEFSDLLEGFRGSNFFKFLGLALFCSVIYYFGVSLFILPGILWVFVTIFVAPLQFYTPMSMTEAIQVSSKVALANWMIVFPCILFALIFSYSGLLLFGIGFLFTFPIWNAVIYVLFKNYFKIKFV